MNKDNTFKLTAKELKNLRRFLTTCPYCGRVVSKAHAVCHIKSCKEGKKNEKDRMEDSAD